MPGTLLRVALASLFALGVAACGLTTSKPIVEVREITCPTEDPPPLPPLPPRPDDLRLLEPDRYRIEGIWKGYQKVWDAYMQSRRECP